MPNHTEQYLYSSTTTARTLRITCRTYIRWNINLNISSKKRKEANYQYSVPGTIRNVAIRVEDKMFSSRWLYWVEHNYFIISSKKRKEARFCTVAGTVRNVSYM